MDLSPSKRELQEAKIVLLDQLSETGIPDKKSTSYPDLTHQVILRLGESIQEQWKQATIFDLSHKRARYVSMYDMVRRQFSNMAALKRQVEEHR